MCVFSRACGVSVYINVCIFPCWCVMSGRRRRTCCATVGQCLSYTSGIYRATRSIYLWGRLGDENFKQPTPAPIDPTNASIVLLFCLFTPDKFSLFFRNIHPRSGYLHTIPVENVRIYKYRVDQKCIR